MECKTPWPQPSMAMRRPCEVVRVGSAIVLRDGVLSREGHGLVGSGRKKIRCTTN